jgi:G2/mitotic-specific cyclin-B, other
MALQKESLIASKYASENCLGLQEEIHVKMRRILVDWLIDVHMKFKLLPETLFITINLVDRYSQEK